MVKDKLSLNLRDGQKIPWPVNQKASLPCSKTLFSLSAITTWHRGFSLPHFLAPPIISASQFSWAGQSLGFEYFGIINALSSSFHGLQDDHKLSIKELEKKYDTNIITVSYQGIRGWEEKPWDYAKDCTLKPCA